MKLKLLFVLSILKSRIFILFYFAGVLGFWGFGVLGCLPCLGFDLPCDRGRDRIDAARVGAGTAVCDCGDLASRISRGPARPTHTARAVA